MRNTIKKIKHISKDLRLSNEEQVFMREKLIRYIEAHPLQHVSRTSSARKKFPFFFNMRSKRVLSGIVLLGILAGGSLSFAAEGTLPGDTLYPIKINMNEPVRGAILVSSQAKADWDMRLVERRLDEITKLSESRGASPEVRQTAEEKLANYTDRVKKHIDRFENQNDHEEAVLELEKFTDILRKHERALEKINIEEDTIELTKVISTQSATSSAGVSSIEKSSQSTERALKKLRREYEYVEKKKQEFEKRDKARDSEINAVNSKNLEGNSKKQIENVFDVGSSTFGHREYLDTFHGEIVNTNLGAPLNEFSNDGPHEQVPGYEVEIKKQN